MIGMTFVSFIILLGISIVVSFVLHYLLKFFLRPGWISFSSKVILGWIGAWLGTPVFGRWFEGVNYQNVFIIPAILGCLAFLVIMTDLVKSFKATLQ